MQPTQTSSNAALMARRQAAVTRGVGQAHEIFVSRAKNAELWDVEGRRYIDFAGGIAVLNTGHLHTEVIAAVKAQLDLYTHTCFQVVAYEPYVELAEKLNALAPGNFAKKTLLLTTGRILSQYNVGAQTRRTANLTWHEKDVLEVHPNDAEDRGIREGDLVKLKSRAGEVSLRARITDRVAPGVVYTTFHHPDTQANVITTDYSDWATNCPEYKVTAVEVSLANGPTDWQERYKALSDNSRRIHAEPAE